MKKKITIRLNPEERDILHSALLTNPRGALDEVMQLKIAQRCLFKGNFGITC